MLARIPQPVHRRRAPAHDFERRGKAVGKQPDRGKILFADWVRHRRRDIEQSRHLAADQQRDGQLRGDLATGGQLRAEARDEDGLPGSGDTFNAGVRAADAHEGLVVAALAGEAQEFAVGQINGDARQRESVDDQVDDALDGRRRRAIVRQELPELLETRQLVARTVEGGYGRAWKIE